MDLVSQNRAPVRQRNLVGEERVIAIDDVLMKATLDVPIGAHAIIVLLHADSAGRFGVETRFIDEVLGQSGFGTLEVDLLTPAEEGELSKSRHPEQFSPRMLRRVVAAVDWLESQPETRGLAVGLLASRTETVAALMTAERCNRVAAVVSLGGCPDYASDAVHELRTPILVLFGRDEQARAAELACEFFARHLRS
jgi:hypothetical protein